MSGAHDVQRLLAKERLGIDLFEPGRTTFLSHVGSTARLVPGSWMGHRELVYALALANLTPSQRSALAKAVIVEHERQFGVGRLALEALPSGLPLGGSSLSLTPRDSDGLRCVYTWALGPGAKTAEADWLLLRAQPSWARTRPARALTASGLETLVELGGHVLMLLPSAVAARQVGDLVAGKVAVHAHPRFAPHLSEHDASAQLMLWPHDALGSATLAQRTFNTVVLVAAPESVRHAALRWAVDRPRCEVVDAEVPGRLDRAGIETFWRSCGKPKILLRGDSEWASEGASWLESLGAQVDRQRSGTQLGLF